MENNKDLKTVISEALQLRNHTREKLAQLTGVSEHYILAIENLDTAKLPAAPYVRGYIKKISQALGLSSEEIWQLYEQELAHKRSGVHDRLPFNRYAIQPVSKKLWIAGAAAILLIGYFSLHIKSFFGVPALEIDSPAAATSISENRTVAVAGHIDQNDKLTINGEEVLSKNDGSFQSEYNLQAGLNTIEFKTKRFLGKERVVVRQVLYQPPAAGQPATTTINR